MLLKNYPRKAAHTPSIVYHFLFLWFREIKRQKQYMKILNIAPMDEKKDVTYPNAKTALFQEVSLDSCTKPSKMF